MAENDKNLLAFRGGEAGFIGNHYAIWQSGLGGEEANLWAKRAGIRTSIAALNSHSIHGNAVYKQLIDFLWKIQKQEEDKEELWINNKLTQFSSSGIEPEYLEQVRRAVADQEYGLAYTLMTQAHKDLDELKRELGKSGSSMARLNKFWKAQFETYFVKRLDSAFKEMELDGTKVNLTLEEIVNDWFENLLQDSNVVPDSIEYIKGTIQNGMVALFEKQNIQIKPNSNLLDVNYKNFVGAKRVRKTKGGKKNGSETLDGLVTRISKTINQGLQRGLSAEVLAIGEGGRGGVSMGTGNIGKTIVNELEKTVHKNIQQKGDVISIEAYSTQIDYSAYAEQYFSAIQEGGEEGLKLLEKQLEKIINDTKDIYIVEVNTKGYQSLRDMAIEREGSFYARMNNLYRMKDQFPQKSIDQLIFLLNNTMDDCVASHDIDLLGDYFSAIFAAWMWDDYTEMFKLASGENNVKRIRVFNSGGVYFSASQMMKRTLEDLDAKVGSNSFIYATISPPSFDPTSVYNQLKTRYPVEGVPGGEERQNILAQRWNEMRDKVMKEGRVSVHIRQKQLDELFGKLLAFM